MNKGIKYRILSRMIAVMLTILIGFAAISYFTFTLILRNNTARLGSDEAQKNLSQVESAVEDIYRFGEILSLNENVERFLTKTDYRSPSERVVEVTHLMSSLKQSMMLKQYIHSFCLVTVEGDAYWSTCPYDTFFIDWFNSFALRGTPLKDATGFSRRFYFPPNSGGGEYVTLSGCVSTVYRVRNAAPEPSGQIIVNLNLGTLMRTIAENSLFNQIAILDDRDRLLCLSSGDERKFMQGYQSFNGTFGKTNGGYYFVNSVSNANWKIVSFMADQRVDASMDFPYISIVLSIIIVALALVFVGIFPLLLQITRQIVKLNDAISLVAKGDLDVSVDLSGARELRDISNGFNHMVVETKQYMQDAMEQLEARQKVSFELLLAKINPHFIYNTLNSIIYLARKGKSKEIIDLTSAFIFLLQDSIHLEGNGISATVETELEVIKKYVTIQKYRYADRFEFQYTLEESLKGAHIPKNILQPLVENAILHGICANESKGHISLEIKNEDSLMEILVIDDGAGMEQETADRLLTDPEPQSHRQASNMRPIGIRNIWEKLQFIYEDQFRFTITSALGKGATIRILLPVRRQPLAPHNKSPR